MGFGDLMKGGWHPEGGGGGSSSKTSSSSSSGGSKFGGLSSKFGGSKFGGGGSSGGSAGATHEYREPTTPLSALKDPHLFPPPPKHREFHPDAPPATISPEYAYLYQPALERQQAKPDWRAQFRPGAVAGQPGAPAPQAGQAPQAAPQYAAQPGQQYGQPGQQYGQQPQYAASQYPPAQYPGGVAQQPAPPYGTVPPQVSGMSTRPVPAPPPRTMTATPSSYAPAPAAVPAQVPAPGYGGQPGYQGYAPQYTQPPTPQYAPQAPQAPQAAPAAPAPPTQQYAAAPSPAASPAMQQQGFVKGHGYSQSLSDTSPMMQGTPQFPNFAAEISRARTGASTGSNGSTEGGVSMNGQRVPSGHRPSQSMSVVGKKAPPPPPKKNASLRGRPTGTTPPPGPVPSFNGNGYGYPATTDNKRNRIPPQAQHPAIQKREVQKREVQKKEQAWQAPAVDLELESKWYAQDSKMMQLSLPSYFKGKTYVMSMTTSGDQKAVVIAVRSEDLSRSKFRIEFNRYRPEEASAQRIDYPPPERPSSSDLEAAASAFGPRVAGFCAGNVGRQVGNGECWTLARDALKSAGALESIGYVHGVKVYEGGEGEGGGEDVREGDVVQFKNARFKDGYGEKIVGMPDHTAVVRSVEGRGPLRVRVYEQNIGGVKVVREGEYEFGSMVEGEVVVYRPFWKEWAGELGSEWP
ncbi:hypothetical protein BZA70DRAFT_164019 [Myxozyma melibiosi]|uniref:BBC1/AIM3 cysteine proteinase-fold domain-containing protein n=1 Tax=Myxozyma melibiosi TaxID=54550 RepID=A0ABR1F6W0_9ASCO